VVPASSAFVKLQIPRASSLPRPLFVAFSFESIFLSAKVLLHCNRATLLLPTRHTSSHSASTNCSFSSHFTLRTEIGNNMLFFSLIVSAFSALAAAQAASGSNPLVPINGSVQAGQPLTINWQKNTQGTVSLQLRWGNANALNPGTTIASMY
jgi:hypothetical protein